MIMRPTPPSPTRPVTVVPIVPILGVLAIGYVATKLWGVIFED